MSILMNMRDVGIDRTMKQIRSQFKTLDTEMRRSNANFKNSEKSMQSFQTRTKELNKAIDVTENSMKDISSQLKKMTLEEQRTSVEAEKLRQEYSKQHRALQMYQRQLNSTQSEMKQFSTTSKQTLFSMKKINTVLGTMKRQLNIANMAFQSAEKSTTSYKNYLTQLNTVIQKHQNTIRVLESRYQKVVREQGVMSKEALELKEKILQEKNSLNQLDNQYKKTTAEAKRFSFEQKTLTSSMSEIRAKMTQLSQSLSISANKFKLSGQTAQAYKARIAELNNGMKQQQLIVQNLSRQYDYAKKQYGATSQEAQQLNAKLTEERVKLKELNGQLTQTTQAHNRLEMEQKQGISSMAQIRAKMTQFNDTLALSRSNLSRAGESVKAYKAHLDTLSRNLTKQRTVLRELSAQYKHVANAQGENSQEARELASAITQQKIKMNELETEIDETTQSYKRLAQEQKQAQYLSGSGFGKGIQTVNKYKDSINNVGSSMRNVGSNMSMYFTLPVVAGFGAAIKTGADFEGQMSRVGAIAGSSKSQLKAMSDQAVDLGAKTSLSASEVAKGMEELAALGMNTNQIMKAMPGVISAAEASGSDLATTATIMASSLNSFNLKASDSGHVADLLATAANDSAADVQYMGDALKYAGTPAHSLGVTLEDTSAAIEVMSNSGLEGSQAGTALRASFIRLAKPSAQSQKAIDKLGISLSNSKGEFVGMPNLIGQFKDALQGMTKDQKLAYVAQIVGTEAASGFLALIDAGPAKLKKYSDSLKNSNGASKEAADKMKDNLKGSLEQLGGAFESLGITIGTAFAPVLRGLAKAVTFLVEKFNNMPTPLIVLTTIFVGLGAAIGPLLVLTGILAHSIVGIAEATTLLTATEGGQAFFTKFGANIKGILPKIGGLITRIPLIGGLMTALTGPIGIAVAAIAAIGVAFVVAYKKSETFRNIVNAVINPVKNAFIGLWNIIKQFGAGIKAVFNGNTGEGLNIFKKILPDEAARQFTSTLLMIRGAYNDFVNFIKSISMAVGAYFKAFWKENGDSIIAAFQIVKATVSIVLNTLYNAIIKPILGAIKTSFSIVFNGIKQIVINVFTSIRMVVQGGLNVIRGIINIFKGLFTGDFSLMWQGIKQVFSGALQVIAGILRFALGNLVIIAKTLGALLINAFRAIWTVIKNVIILSVRVSVTVVKALFTGMENAVIAIFTGLKNLSIAIWNGLKNGVIAIVRGFVLIAKNNFAILRAFLATLWNVIKATAIRIWTALKNGVIAIIRAWIATSKATFNGLKNFLVNLWNFIKNTTLRIWRSIKTGVVNAIKLMSTSVRKTIATLKAWMVSSWNFIKNRVVALAKGLYTGVKKAFSSLWASTKSIFSKLKNWLVNTWRSLKNSVVKLAKSLYSSVKNTFNNLWSSTKNIFSKLKNWLVNTWRSIKNKVTDLAKSLWNGVKNTWSKMKSGTHNTMSKISSGTKSTWRGMKNSVVDISKALWSKVRGTFTNMRDGLKSIIGKIKSHIGGMVNSVKNGLNKLIEGVNWVAGKLGMKDLPKIKLHTGTESTHTQNYVTNGKLNRGTIATVGDKGKGNGPGGFRHEMIRYPNGKTAITPNRDTTTFLPKGSTVYNGAQTHAMLTGQPQFHNGTIPRFASGTKKNMIAAVGEQAGKLFNGAKKLNHKALDNIGEKANEAKEWGSDKLSQIKGVVGKGASWLKDKVGDLADWLGKPGKLLNKVLEAFGVNMDVFGIGKNAELPYNMMKAMFKKLKEAAKNLIDGWLEDEFSGGGGYNPYTKAPFQWVRGWSAGGHAGIDYGAPTGTPIPSPIDGKVIKSWQSPWGGGNETQVYDGNKYTHIFMHQSRRGVSAGDKVHQGEILGKVGSTGNSSGPHLHWQVNKGKGYLNNHPDSIDPLKWVKEAAKAGGGGVNKSAAAWKPDIRRAAKQIGVHVSAGDVNDVARLIQTESSGNAGVTQQIQDVNSGGNEAQGLLQYTPGSFSSYAIRGHKNIKNGYDQLLAFFNNTDWRANLSYWKRRMASGLTGWGPTGSRKKFATGGLIKSAGWYNIAEGGYPEWVIPTDPSRHNDAMKMLALAAQDIDRKSSTRGNKRPNSLPKPSGSNDNDVLLQMLQAQQQQIALLTQIVTSNQTIADKNFEPTIDKYTHEQQVFNSIDKYNRQKQRKSRFKPGEVT
ncbi:phage tail tape measure protein [Staphylococcus haemolyticus]|uniref:phage tail tape measure protein n=1 Tax=Staphylococcus haemolyticus TaxID=1283 RepID=UPI00374F846E